METKSKKTIAIMLDGGEFMVCFVTGAAGFIGYFLSKRLLNEGAVIYNY